MADIVIKCTYIISLLFMLSFFCPSSSLRHHAAPCEVVNLCNCEFPSGEGIDLYFSSLSQTTLRTNLTGNATVLFRPCHPIDHVKCNNALCLFNGTTNQVTPLGTVEELKYISENVVKPVKLQFVHGQITSTIDLICLQSGNGTSYFNGSKINDNEYHFVLKSHAVCIRPLLVSHGHSFISVLLISILIIGVTYVVAMMVVRHNRGAIGWELLPHHDMCMRIPGLCQAGYNSLSSCCRLQPSYQQI